MSLKRKLDDDIDFCVETREAFPSHFLCKIEGFSRLSGCEGNKYESTEFEVGGYKWRLVIYPDGKHGGNNKEFISVYLAVANTNSLPPRWGVNAIITLFLHDKKTDNFVSKRDRTRRFHDGNQEWGFPKFISKKIFEDASNGYLVDDNCIFGAEVFVLQIERITECLFLPKVMKPRKRRITISEFSKLKDEWESEKFVLHDQNWKVTFWPRGCRSAKGQSVSIFLHLVDCKSSCQKVKAEYTFRMIDQISSNHRSLGCYQDWFGSSIQPAWGLVSFARMNVVNNPAKGFVVEDCCILEVEISVLAVANCSK